MFLILVGWSLRSLIGSMFQILGKQLTNYIIDFNFDTTIPSFQIAVYANLDTVELSYEVL